jgi:hypothetical protein
VQGESKGTLSLSTSSGLILPSLKSLLIGIAVARSKGRCYHEELGSQTQKALAVIACGEGFLTQNQQGPGFTWGSVSVFEKSA